MGAKTFIWVVLDNLYKPPVLMFSLDDRLAQWNTKCNHVFHHFQRIRNKWVAPRLQTVWLWLWWLIRKSIIIGCLVCTWCACGEECVQPIRVTFFSRPAFCWLRSGNKRRFYKWETLVTDRTLINHSRRKQQMQLIKPESTWNAYCNLRHPLTSSVVWVKRERGFTATRLQPCEGWATPAFT